MTRTSSVHRTRWPTGSTERFCPPPHEPTSWPSLPSLYITVQLRAVPSFPLCFCPLFAPNYPDPRAPSSTQLTLPSPLPSWRQRSGAAWTSSALSTPSWASPSAWHCPPGRPASWESLAFGTRLSRCRDGRGTVGVGVLRRRHLGGWRVCAHSPLVSFSLKVLQQALEGFGEPWDLSPGDGAFYGPKVSWGLWIEYHLFTLGSVLLSV